MLRIMNTLKVKLFADGASLDEIKALAAHEYVRGFTTNPSLMRRAGVTSYRDFALAALKLIGDRPISFEVLADTFYEMHRQACEVASWGPNVYVKIPITDTKGNSTRVLIRELTEERISVNVTAVMTVSQVRQIRDALRGEARAYVSVFAGRIADTGIDPVPIIREMKRIIGDTDVLAELIWASSRELFNVVQADEAGCDIITLTSELLNKLPLLDRTDLEAYSLETVKMFYDDAVRSGLTV